MFDDVDIGSGLDSGGYTVGGGYDGAYGDVGSTLGQYYDMGDIGGSTTMGGAYGTQAQDFPTYTQATALGQAADAGTGGGSSLSTGPKITAYGQPKTSAIPGDQPAEKQNSMLKAIGMSATKDGTATDFADPKSLLVLLKGLGIGGNLLNSLITKNKQANAQTPAALAATLPANKYATWSPTQQQWADQYFNTAFTPPQQRQRLAAADMPNPTVASRNFAGGGGIGAPGDERYGNSGARRDDSRFDNAPTDIWSRTRARNEQQAGVGNPGATRMQQGSVPRRQVGLDEFMPSILRALGYATGGSIEEDQGDGPTALGYVAGDGNGQADDVKANLSHGEYVWDADVVSALGDGNNAAGASILDAAREAIRSHKRSAPPDQIPPPAKPLEEYMQPQEGDEA